MWKKGGIESKLEVLEGILELKMALIMLVMKT